MNTINTLKLLAGAALAAGLLAQPAFADSSNGQGGGQGNGKGCGQGNTSANCTGGGTGSEGGAGTGDPVSGNIYINGSVSARCDITNDPVTINLGELAAADGTLDTSKVNTKQQTLTAWCNGAGSTMKVESTPIALSPAVGVTPAGFAQSVDYTATATANAIAASDTSTVAGAGAASTVGAFSGSVPVVLSAAATTGGAAKLLMAGNYVGVTTVTLTPGL